MASSKTRRTRRWIGVIKVLLFLVIAVIFIGLLFPGSHVGNAARNAQALDDETQLAAAISAFHKEYGRYPCDKNAGDDSKDCFASGGTGEARLLNILFAIDNDASVEMLNPKKIVYLDVPKVKDPKQPRTGIGPDGVWYDPWGSPYLVKIDSNENGRILNPYSANAGDAELEAGVIVWSLGRDGKGAISPVANGDKNTGFNRDDVISWSQTWHLVH